ncbi:MAG: penicillin-binding protein, partial [Candidatus Methylopumilus sp.]
LPIWIDYMASALKGMADVPYAVPEGVSSIKIDLATGTRANEDESGVYEYFYHEFPPPEIEPTFTPIPGFPDTIPGHESNQNKEIQPDQLF